MNQITIAGNTGNDIELRIANSGTSIASFSVAVNRKRGEETDTTWFRVVAFGEMAENLTEVAKGTRVIVTGRMSESRWTDADGNERRTMEILADEVGPSLRWKPRGSAGGSDAFGEETPF
jgi:single-strand DNA-binding protein